MLQWLVIRFKLSISTQVSVYLPRVYREKMGITILQLAKPFSVSYLIIQVRN